MSPQTWAEAHLPVSLDSDSLTVTTTLLSSFSYPAPLYRLGSKLGRDSMTLFRKKVLMSNEILETKENIKTGLSWFKSLRVTETSWNCGKMENKMHIYPVTHRWSCGWALTGNDPMAASVAQGKRKCGEVPLSLGNRKPRFSDSLCSSETTDPITRCMCISHVLWEKLFIFFQS